MNAHSSPFAIILVFFMGACTQLADTTAVAGYGHAVVLAVRSLENLGLGVFEVCFLQQLGDIILPLPKTSSLSVLVTIWKVRRCYRRFRIRKRFPFSFTRPIWLRTLSTTFPVMERSLEIPTRSSTNHR